MNPKLLCRVGLALALLGLFASRGPAAEDDEEAALPSLYASCQLYLAIDEQGTATVTLHLFHAKSAKVRPQQLEKALTEVLGVPAVLKAQRMSPAGMNSLMLNGRAALAFPPENDRIEGEVDLTPLAALVRPLGVQQITLSISERRTQANQSGPRPMGQMHRAVPTEHPEPVHFVLGPDRGYYAWRGVVLVGLFLVPIGLVFFQRWAALRGGHTDPAVAWYRFWRWAHWVTLGTWLVWLTAVPALDLDAVIHLWWPVGGGRFHTLRLVVMVLPPWLVMLTCAALTHEVFGHLSRAPQLPGTIFRRAGWGILTTLLPLLLAVFGLFALVEGSYRGGAAWLGAALVVRLVARRLAGVQDLTPHAVSSGELRDRIFELAGQAGVRLRQLFIVPSGKMPVANAFAVLGGNVLMTEHLLRNLDRREVDAIAAHELGHLKFRHPIKLMGVFLVVMILAAIIQPALGERFHDSWLRHIPLSLILALVAAHFVSRRFEHQTDSYAAWLVADPEALITGLIKVHRLSLMPMRWGQWEEGLLTHPSTDLRLEVIARENGLSRQRLQEVVDAPNQPPAHYPLPATFEDENLVFSPAFKRRSVAVTLRLMQASVLLTPALFAAVVWWGDLQGAARWVVLAAGVVFTPAVLLTLLNYLPPKSYPEIRRRLGDKLRAQGIDPSGGTFVAFAPHAEPRIYEGGYTNWDFGFLFLLGDRLCYVGEHTRFSLHREQITGLRLVPGMHRWWRVPQVAITWEDRQRGTSGAFNVRAGEIRTMRQLQHATPDLERTLRRWLEQPTAPGEVPPSLVELSTPAIGEVTSVPVRAVIRLGPLVYRTAVIVAIGAGISLLLGLPFDFERGGLAWYVPVVTVLTVLFESAPVWRNRFAGGEEVPSRQKTTPAQPPPTHRQAAPEEAGQASSVTDEREQPTSS